MLFDGMTLDELRALRTQIQTQIAGGVERVQTADRSITYAAMEQRVRILADLTAAIAALEQDRPRPRVIYTTAEKGL